MIAVFSKRALNCSACYCVSEQDHKDLVGKVESRAGCRLGGRWKKDVGVSVQVVGFENMGVLTASAKARTLICEFQRQQPKRSAHWTVLQIKPGRVLENACETGGNTLLCRHDAGPQHVMPVNIKYSPFWKQVILDPIAPSLGAGAAAGESQDPIGLLVNLTLL